MTDSFLKIDQQPMTLRRFIASLFLNALINTAIAVILHAIRFGQGFLFNLIFSQCIGFSIYFAQLAAMPLYRRITRPAAQVAVIVAVVLAGAVGGTLLGAAATGLHPASFVREELPLFGRAVLLGIFFGAVVSYVFISVEKISEERLRRTEIEKAAMEAELRLVQSQIEPHFLFNTLANIRSLIDSDPRTAGGMLETFVSFLRTSLHAARERIVPLSAELDLVKSYLDLMAVRMGDRLRRRIELPDELRQFPIPPLLIQPLAENAVKHGLEPSVAGGEVAIRAMRDGDRVRIIVSDTGPGMQNHGVGSGVGLENVRKRLELLYQGKGRMVIEENEPAGVRVIIEISEVS